MTIPFQNLRSAIPGAQPAQLDAGQVAFNVSDATMYLGTGADTKIDFSGAVVTPNPPAGKGWVQVLLNRVALNDFFIQNPEAAGRPAPTNEQVLTYNAALDVAEWQDAGTGFPFQTTDALVTAAPGATTSAKIISAIGSPAYIGSNATVIVVGNPGDTYEGLYIYSGTVWVFAAHYAFNTATQVPATDPTTLAASTTQAVLNALKLVDDGLQTQATTSALNIGVLQGQMATAQTDITGLQASKLDKASNIPAVGQILSYNGVGQLWVDDSQGDVTGVTGTLPITVNNTNPQTPVVGINAATTSAVGAVQLSNSTSSIAEDQASTPLATKTAWDLANAAVPRSTYAAQGNLVVGSGAGTFSALSVGSSGQILAVGAGGALNWVNDSQGDVTSVTGTAPITVNNSDPQTPIVAVELATTATPGVVQIELTGNLTLVGGIIDVPNASTTVKGAVSLNNTLGSTSTTEALTAAQGNALQNQINALTVANSVDFAGGYNATTGLVDDATAAGIAAGFIDGSAPPLPGPGNANYYLICTTSGLLPSAMQNGDWLLSDGTAYLVLGIGARPAQASYIETGIVQLADAAAVLAGTSDVLAITPQALQDNIIDSVTTANSSQIASATAVKTANDNAVAAQGTANTALSTANAALPKAGGTMAGDITFSGSQTFPVSGVADATTGSKGIVQIGTNVQVSSGTISVLNGSTSQTGVVQLNDSVISTSTSTAATANAAKTAYDLAGVANTTANAALPKNGGTMTGSITFQDTGEGLIFNGGSSVSLISDSVSTTSSTTAASSTAVKSANDLANAALPKTGGTVTGNITFQDAGEGVIFSTGSSIVNISDATGNTNSDIAASSTAVNNAYNLADAAIPKSTLVATGSLIYASAAGTPANLNIGSSGLYLSVVGGLPAWASPPVALEGYTQTVAPFNTALGANAGNSLTTGANNVSIGHDAGTQISSGINNVTVGYQAGDSITTGSNNITIGYQAMAAATTATNNIAIGLQALGYSTIAGGGNIGIGSAAGANLSSGTANVLIGSGSGDSLTTSSNNTAVGNNSLGAATTGSKNVCIGLGSGVAITTGSNNTIIGDTPATAATTGNLILAAGTTIKFQANNSGAWSYDGTNFGTAGQVLTSGGTGATPIWTTPEFGDITAVNSGSGLTGGGTSGDITLSLDSAAVIAPSLLTTTGDIIIASAANTPARLGIGTSGQYLGVSAGGVPEWQVTLSGFTNAATPFNTALGGNAGNSITTGANNTLVGFDAGTAIGSGTNNTFVGFQAGDLLVNGNFNTALGSLALSAQTTGNNNTALGAGAGDVVTTGAENTFVGSSAGGGVTTASSMTSVGYLAGGSGSVGTTGMTAVGWRSLQISTGVNNTAVGFNTGGAITTGNNNTILGYSAGDTIGTGVQNTFIGSFSGTNAAAAIEGSTAVGYNSLALGVLSGTGNTALGNQSGANVTSGAFNTLVGFSAGSSITTGGFNTLVGRYGGTAALSNNVVLSDGSGIIKLQINQNGAVGVGTAPSFGTAGQILSSTGTGTASAWTSALPQVAAPTASTDAGVQGQIASDAIYSYMYTGGRWQRVAWDVTVW